MDANKAVEAQGTAAYDQDGTRVYQGPCQQEGKAGIVSSVAAERGRLKRGGIL